MELKIYSPQDNGFAQVVKWNFQELYYERDLEECQVSYEYICEKCQAHLDPGERCDCELEKERERVSKKSVKMIYPGSIKSRAKGRRTYAL